MADPSGYFITLYTEKRDPSKVLVSKFLNSTLTDIESVRSLPVSGLLFRSLISYAAHEKYKDLERYKAFPLIASPRKMAKNQIQTITKGVFEPFLSKERDFWIAYSFTEEKAHRLAIRIAGQAKRLRVVYCHPTFTQHHRCVDKSVAVLSLSEFLRTLSPTILRRYIQQARVLFNHLKQESDVVGKSITSNELIHAITGENKVVPIHTSELREAKAGLGIVITTTGEAAYVCACANLLNAALNLKLNRYSGSLKLAKEVYSFKAVFARAIEEIIYQAVPDVFVYVERDGPIYISVLGLQFSFHAIPRTPAIGAYQWSERNIPQIWVELRLQPIAPLVLKWARAILLEEKVTRNCVSTDYDRANQPLQPTGENASC